jgi:hypothetical protein
MDNLNELVTTMRKAQQEYGHYKTSIDLRRKLEAEKQVDIYLHIQKLDKAKKRAVVIKTLFDEQS